MNSISCATSPRRRRKSRCRRRRPCTSIAARISPTRPPTPRPRASSPTSPASIVTRSPRSPAPAAATSSSTRSRSRSSAIRPFARRSKARAKPDRLVDLYIESLNEAVSGAPPDVTFGVHMCRGNFKGHYLGAGGYESVAERFFGRARVNHFLLEYDTPRAGDFRRCVSSRTRASCSGSSAARRRRWKTSPISSAAPRKRPGTSISTGSPSARNADLPRRSPATRSPKRMSVPSSSSSSMPPRKSGIDRRPVARGRGPAGRSAAYTASAPR